MFDKILSWLSNQPEKVSTSRSERDLHVAALALLVIAARLDGEFDAAEQQKIDEIAQSRFGISADASRDIIREASDVAASTTDLFSLTNQINHHLAIDKRILVIEMLWDVAYADGVLHDYEANLVRRVAGLLYIEDQESGAARQKVLRRRQIGVNEAI